MIETVKMMWFSTFRICGANNFIRKHELDMPLNVSLRGNCVAGLNQPYWHPCVEEIITNFGTLHKTSHPVGPNGKWGTSGVSNARLYIDDVVKEGQDVEAVPLCLSHEDHDVMKCQWMVE